MSLRLVCLDIMDPAAYAAYRAEMEPLLAQVGGRFLLDVEGGQVHHSPADFVPGRVLLIAFPSAAVAEGFFADPAYQAVRGRWFAPAVRQSVALMLPTD